MREPETSMSDAGQYSGETAARRRAVNDAVGELCNLFHPRPTFMALLPAEVARAACRRMDEAQRIAFAIELLNGIEDPREAPGLLRVARLAQNVSADLMKRQFLKESV